MTKKEQREICGKLCPNRTKSNAYSCSNSPSPCGRSWREAYNREKLRADNMDATAQLAVKNVVAMGKRFQKMLRRVTILADGLRQIVYNGTALTNTGPTTTIEDA